MITIFKNFNEVIEHKTIPEILHEIKTGKYRPGITYLRKSLAENKLEAYEKAKKSLPAFTPSGKFVGGRKMEFLEAYSNFIILDIDKLSQTDLQNAKHKANQSLKHDNNLQKLQRSNRTQNNSRNPARNQNRKVPTRDNLFA